MAKPRNPGHIPGMGNPVPAPVHAGTPNGGWFAAGAGVQDAVESENEISPVPITALGLADGDSLYLTDFDLGDDVFDSVEVHRAGERYTATGTVPVDVYGEVTGGSPDSLQTHDAATRPLTDREADINAFLTDRYGAALRPETEWEEQGVAFSTDLNPATDTTGDILDKLRTHTRARSLKKDMADDSDQGFYRA